MRQSFSSTSTLEAGGEAGLVKSGLMSGRRGLVMGVANDHSIAWGVAQALAAQGAELAFTHQGEALGKRVKPLAASLGSSLVLPCDVEDLASVDQVFDALKAQWGVDGFCRPLHRLFRSRPVEGALRRHVAREFHPHDGRLGVLVHRNRQTRRRADAGGRGDGDPDLRRRDAGDAQLQRHGNRQGGAGGERALSRRRFWRRPAFASTPFPRDPSARWRERASPTPGSCSISSAPMRRCAGP